jgi:hypothetical protein
VIAAISPWNFPLAIFLGQVTAALVAGNAVVAKPAPQTPLIADAAARLLLEAGLPADVLAMVPGGPEVGHHYFLFIPATPEHPQDAAGELLHHRPAEFVPKPPLTVVAYLGAAHVAAGWLCNLFVVEVDFGNNAIFRFRYFSHAGLPFCMNDGPVHGAVYLSA